MADELNTITPVNDVFRRDVEVEDESILDPNESDALVQGEWLQINPATGKYVRADGTQRSAAQVFSQRGDLAAQALKKVAALQLHEYEAETTMFLDSPSVAFTVGAPLVPAIGAIDGVAGRSGLDVQTTSNGLVIGYVTRIPSANGNKLRYVCHSPTQLTP